MRGTNIVTKLSQLDISRIALCKNPADQDAVFVVVKSEGEPATAAYASGNTVPAGDGVATDAAPSVDTEKTEAPEVVEPESPAAETPAIELSKEMREFIEKAIADGIRAAVEKTPIPAGQRTEEFPSSDNVEGKDEMQACLKDLISECNDNKMVPKKVRKKIGQIAKYCGMEGPDEAADGEDVFANVTAELKAVVDILKGLAVSMAKPTTPEPAAPAAKEAPAKPSTSAKKELTPEEIRQAKLRKELDEVRFELLKAMGKDPYPKK